MGIHSSTFKLLPKYKQRQIDEQLDLKGMNRTDGPGWYVTVEIIGPDGPEIYKVWAIDAAADADYKHLRSNPPLSEHMAHDDLDEISALLVRRFVNPDDFHGPLSTRPTPEIFRKFVYNLAKNVAQAAESAAGDADGEVAYDALLSVYDVANDIKSAISTMRRTRRFR